MKIETRVAFSNAKFYKSRNILTGITIFLTTLLLFLVPTVGLDILSTEKAAICDLYPNWHALFEEVSKDTAAKLSSHHLVKASGKMCSLGYTTDNDIKNSLIYMDDAAFTLYRLSLSEGTLPAKENEIAVSKKLLKQLSLDLNVGDSLPLSYQVRKKDGLDSAKKKAFVISGFLADTMDNEDVSSFTSLISEISEVEAMRCHEKDTSAMQKRKGYLNLSIARLTKIHLGKNKKRSLLTICSMAFTGLLFMSVATILSCADPKEAADNSITGEYMFSVNVSSGDKEHPELEWGKVQKNNPLTEKFKQEILKLDGIQKVICFPAAYCVSDVFPDDRNSILGVPESQKETLEQGIIERSISYEELKSGDKVVIDKNLLHWYPDLKIGQVLDVTVDNGVESISRKIEIAAIGDYNIGFTNYSYILMAEEGLNGFSNYSLNHHFSVFAIEKYNKPLESKLKALGKKHGNLEFTSWNDHYKT